MNNSSQLNEYSCEEVKVVMIVDTSEACSSDSTAPREGSNGSEGGVRQIDQTQAQDSYMKIKMHAVQCL